LAVQLSDHQLICQFLGQFLRKNNIFIEPLWWSTKYQYLYLLSFDNGVALRARLEWWFQFYNQERPHQTFDILTPDELVYMGLTAPVIQAA
jgi:putative transposase